MDVVAKSLLVSLVGTGRATDSLVVSLKVVAKSLLVSLVGTGRATDSLVVSLEVVAKSLLVSLVGTGRAEMLEMTRSIIKSDILGEMLIVECRFVLNMV